LFLLSLLLLEQSELESMTWIQAASRLTEDLVSADKKSLAAAGLNSTAEVFARFADARKVSANTVRRQVAAYAFLKLMINPERFQSILSDETPPPFNTIEVLKKLHAVDPELGRSLLPKALSRTVTFAEMTEHFRSSQTKTRHIGPALTHYASPRTFEKQVLRALAHCCTSLYPSAKAAKVTPIHRSVPGFIFALPDGIVTFADGDAKRYDAIEIKMPVDGARHQVWQILERIHLVSSFFTHTWLILPLPTFPGQTLFIDHIVRAKTILGLPSVGISTVAFTDTAEFKIWVEPKDSPEIDRRYLLPEIDAMVATRVHDFP
jgi:hypothetical protein